MLVHHADWVLPIASPPLKDGWVTVAGGRIVQFGAGTPPADAVPAASPFGREPCVILPALANAHTHLELSWMRDRVPPGVGFGVWMEALVTLRRQHGSPFADDVLDAIRMAIQEMRASGTGVVGDIANTLATIAPLKEAGMVAHVFQELIGFNLAPPDADVRVRQARERLTGCVAAGGDVRASVVPHAPYSVGRPLFEAIRADWDAHAGAPASVHLGESAEEMELLRTGRGPIREVLETIGVWTPDWEAPCCGPVEYIERCGLLKPDMLVVHGVQLSDGDLRRVKESNATLVTCPRSNRWTGAGTPPVSRFYASGAKVAIGTDSLASVENLNLFEEIAEVHRLAPDVAPARVLESATRVGAEALAFGGETGTIEPGKRARLIAVRVPAAVRDVEQYLLTGIQPVDVCWLDDDLRPATP
jgi:cytosine/adenosine deaminase-related metal-dependent hydrolase